MNYEKLTPDSFVTKLKNKQYESLTGARRAIGKASWSDADKDAARVKALKFFGDNSVAPAKKTAAPAKKAAAAPKKAAKTAASKAKAPKTAHKATAEAAPRQTVETPAGEHYTDVLSRSKNITIADVRKNPHATLQLAEHGVQSGTSVIKALNDMKDKNPSLEISDTIDAATQTVKAALHLTSLVLQNLSDGIEGKGHSHVKPIISGPVVGSNESTTNGVTEPVVPGTPAYEAPTAEA